MPTQEGKFTRLLAIQQEIGAIKKDKTNPYHGNNYADINDILHMVKPLLNGHGFILTQPLTVVEGRTAIKTLVIDVESGVPVYNDAVFIPEQTDPQKMGSAITYFRRYAIQSLLALEAEDDDGNATQEQTTQSQQSPAPSKKYWIKYDQQSFACNECQAPATRSYGVSKKGKDFNMIKCENEHVQWLQVKPEEMINF